jgi:hypothetical protein
VTAASLTESARIVFSDHAILQNLSLFNLSLTMLKKLTARMVTK